MSIGHYENFPVASRLVPQALRPAVVAIYAFARSADDFADEGDDPPSARLSRLDAYAAQLDRIERGDVPREAPFPALAAAIGRHALPIGRLLLQLYDLTDPESARRADAICTGLQLANFWQDIALDWRKGRVYLPGDDMARFGVTEEQIAAGRCDERWARLVAFEVERTRSLLESGRPLTRGLPLRLALELKLTLAGGLQILRAIDAVDGDVFRYRPRLRGRDWLAMTATALVR